MPKLPRARRETLLYHEHRAADGVQLGELSLRIELVHLQDFLRGRHKVLRFGRKKKGIGMLSGCERNLWWC